MRRKRAKVPGRQKEVDLVYKTLTNTQSKNRGSEMIIILPSAMSKIIEYTQIFARKSHRRIYPSIPIEMPVLRKDRKVIVRHSYQYSQILFRIYKGERYNELDVNFPGHIVTSYLRMALIHLKMWEGVNAKVTLRTVCSSGRLYGLAKQCVLDREDECRRYGVKVWQ